MTFDRPKLYKRHHGHFLKLEKSIRETTGLYFDSAGQKINFIQRMFLREACKLLNKNLNFVPIQNTIKQDLYNQIEEFRRCIKLKTHFLGTPKQAHLCRREYRLGKQYTLDFE